jgi:hypothetical protein
MKVSVGVEVGYGLEGEEESIEADVAIRFEVIGLFVRGYRDVIGAFE